MASRRHWHFATLAAAALLAACGGGNGISGAQDAPIASRVVIFGDSLSDVGTYTGATTILRVLNPTDTRANGPYFGGKFTTNTFAEYQMPAAGTSRAAGNTSTANTWGEWVAARLGVSITPAEAGFATTRVPCPALATIGANSCTGYAQGGSRVTDPNGIGKSSGFLTIPVVAQIASHNTRTVAGFRTGFDSSDIVFVWAGNNDAFTQFGAVGANAITPTAAVANMVTAATELATLVKNEILAKGATRVAVMTLPDAANTPQFAGLPADQKALLSSLSAQFNGKLTADLAGTAARIIDARALSAAVYSNPSSFGITNVTTAACGVTAFNPGASSLLCNASSAATFQAGGAPNLNGLVAGANPSTWLFADGVHPTTGGHKIFSDQVITKLKEFGWIPNNL